MARWPTGPTSRLSLRPSDPNRGSRRRRRDLAERRAGLLALAGLLCLGAVSAAAAEIDCPFPPEARPGSEVAAILAEAYPEQHLAAVGDALRWPDGTPMPVGGAATGPRS